MKLAQRIYCIEGHWDYGNREVEPSVEPMLNQIRNMGLWDYARRNCATLQELEYFLNNEWWHRCRKGSILYFATHGSPGAVSLSDEHFMTLDQLGAELEEGGCEGCLVHFSGCEVMATTGARLREFMDRTGAIGVSGYKTDVGWAGALESNGRRRRVPGAPALALELMFFSTIRTEGIQLADGRSSPRLEPIAKDLQRRFQDCKFELKLRGSM